MDEKEEPLFDETSKPWTGAKPPDKEEIVEAVRSFTSGDSRRDWQKRIVAHAPPKKASVEEPPQVTSLGDITYDLEPKPSARTIFPNAYQLGLDAEKAVYSTILAYYWQKEGKLTEQLNQAELRESALKHFMGNHRKKAFAVADTIYSLRKAFLNQADDPGKVVELFFNKAHEDHRSVQIGLQGFETVIFSSGNTLNDLKRWSQYIANTGKEAQLPYFEMLVETRLGNRVIKHPFDIVFEDFTGDLHIIELSNRHRESYLNKARLVEDAILELVADRAQAGRYDQQLSLTKPMLHVGCGEVWTIKDRPDPRKVLLGVHLKDHEMREALAIMRGAKVVSGKE